MNKSTGYGILTNKESGREGSLNNVPIERCEQSYGSLDNASISTTDSRNQWEGLENDYDIGYSGSIEVANTAHGTPRFSRRPSDFYGYYDSYGGENQEVSNLNSDYSRGYINADGQPIFDTHEQDGLQYLASTPLVGWNIINLLLSTSLLAFPFVFKEAGYVVLPLILILALVMSYTSKILIGMMYETSPTHDKTIRVRRHYTELGREVFDSENGARFVQVIQLIEMLAICILNICVLGQLGEEITEYNVQVCTAIAALLALPTFFIRKLAIIGWLQTIGVISLSIGLLLIQGWCLAHAGAFKPSSVPLVNVRKVPVAIGVIIYAYGIQGVLPGMEEQMKRPKQFGSVVNVTFGIAIVVQCIFSVTNAMYYGDKTAQVIVIDLKDHFELGIASACFICISILSHFSLPTLVVMESLDNYILKTSSCCPSRRESLHTFLMVLLRIGIMGLSLGVAITLPYFAYLMGFIGSAITLFMSLILPCSFHLKLKYDSMHWYQKLVDILVILCSIVCLGAGSYFSFESIYYDITEHTYE